MAVKKGTVAFMMESNPALMFIAARAKKQKGMAILVMPTITINSQLSRSCCHFPNRKHMGSITIRPLATRISTRNIGPISGAATRRNRKEKPHTAESINSST